MGLSNKQNNSNNGADYFINVAKVADVVDCTGQSVKRKDGSIAFTPQLWIKVALDIGKDFMPELDIKGDLKFENGELKWGSAFKISDFLWQCGVETELSDDNKLNPAHLRAACGATVTYLRYKANWGNGDTGYNNWDRIVGGDNATRMAKIWKESLKKGFPKDFAGGSGSESGTARPNSYANTGANDRPF